MPRQENKLAPEGVVAKAGNFLMNITVAVGWLLRRIAEALTGKKIRKARCFCGQRAFSMRK